MSNSIELERKMLLTKSVAEALITEFESNGTVANKDVIEQNYLFKENAEVKYDCVFDNWTITLKTTEGSIDYSFKEKNHPETARLLFSEYQGLDLLDLKCASRIRMKNNVPIFTFKMPIGNGKLGDYEFEDDISEAVKNSLFFKKFIEEDPYKVIKNRVSIVNNGLKYEFDNFKNVDLSEIHKSQNLRDLGSNDLCLLEIEFDNEVDYNAFEADFNCIDVSGTAGFGNKGMAKKNGKKENLEKTKKKGFKW